MSLLFFDGTAASLQQGKRVRCATSRAWTQSVVAKLVSHSHTHTRGFDYGDGGDDGAGEDCTIVADTPPSSSRNSNSNHNNDNDENMLMMMTMFVAESPHNNNRNKNNSFTTTTSTSTSTNFGSNSSNSSNSNSSGGSSSSRPFASTTTAAASMLWQKHQQEQQQQLRTCALPPRPLSVKALGKVRVSTMTGVFEMTQPVDLCLLARNATCSVIFDLKGSAFGRKTAGMSFGGQTTLVFRVGKTTAVYASVFSTGKVKVAGLQAESQLTKVAALVCKQCQKTNRVSWDPSGPPPPPPPQSQTRPSPTIDGASSATTTTDAATTNAKQTEPRASVANPALLESRNLRIVMIKADFDLGFPVSLSNSGKLLADLGYFISYDPTRYPALVVSVPMPTSPKPLKMMIFATGKAFVTGSSSVPDVANVYSTIQTTLVSNFAQIKGVAPIPSLSQRQQSSLAPGGGKRKRKAAVVEEEEEQSSGDDEMMM